MSAGLYVFNQYCYDLLKKLKQCAKKLKEKSNVAKQVSSSIKKHYTTFDKMSNEHYNLILDSFASDFWDILEDSENPVEKMKTWAKDNQETGGYIFQDISLQSVLKIVKEDGLIHQYLLTLKIFKDPELTDDEVKNIVEKLKGIDDDIETPERHATTIKCIIDSHMKNVGGFTMDDIKGTQIGDLAKNIMDDLNLDKIKENVKKEGDIMKALGDSEHGIGNILSSVSTKMASKFSNGELKSDKLIQEAVGLAGKLPGFNNGGGGSGGGDAPSGTPDLANIMQMMQGMMGGMPNMPSSRKMKRTMKKKGLS